MLWEVDRRNSKTVYSLFNLKLKKTAKLQRVRGTERHGGLSGRACRAGASRSGVGLVSCNISSHRAGDGLRTLSSLFFLSHPEGLALPAHGFKTLHYRRCRPHAQAPINCLHQCILQYASALIHNPLRSFQHNHTNTIANATPYARCGPGGTVVRPRSGTFPPKDSGRVSARVHP